MAGFDYNFDITAEIGAAPVEDEVVPFDHEDANLLAFAAGIERQSWFSSFVNDKIRGVVDQTFTVDEEYDPALDDANRFYDPGEIATARSGDEAAYIRSQIDNEYSQLKMIHENSWGMVGEVVGSFSRPEVLAATAVPVLGWGRVLAIETGAEIFSEAALHEQQRTRTGTESLVNIASVAAMTGILGKGSEMLAASKKYKTSPGTLAKEEAETSADFGETFGPDSASAARAVKTTAADDKLVGAAGLENAAIGPMARMSTSKSDAARDAANNMADKSFYTQGMVEGKTSGVSVEAEANAAMGELVNHLEAMKGFAADSGLRGGIPGFRFYGEFNREVGIAMRNGDVHKNPKVQEAAEYMRKNVFEPRADAARELGHTFEDSKFAKSYMPRVYNRAAVAKGYGDLKTKLTKMYSKEFAGQRTEANRIADVEYVAATEKEFLASEKLIDKVYELEAVVKRTAKQVVQLDKARGALKTSTAKLDKIIAEGGPPKMRRDILQKQLDGLNKRAKKRAKGSRSKTEIRKRKALEARIKVLNKEVDASVKAKAAKYVDELNMSKADIAREADRAAKDTIQNMLGGLPSGHGVGAGLPKALKERTVALTDNMLEEYLEQDVVALAAQYAAGMDPYLLMKQRFGDESLGDVIEKIGKEYQELIDAASSTAKGITRKSEKERLIKQRDSDIDDISAMRDRILHRVQRGMNPGSSLEKTVQAVKVFNVSTQLGGIVLSSLPDLARPLMSYGLMSFARGWAKQTSVMKGASKEQIRRMGIASQRALNSRLMDLADLAEQPVGNSAIDGMKSAWGKLTLFDQWTDAMEGIAAQTAMDWTLNVGKKIDKAFNREGAGAIGDSLSRSERMKIARMGFTPEDVANFYRSSQKTGGNDPDLMYANTLEWADPDLGKLFEAGLGSSVRRDIVRIGVGDKPLIMDNTIMSLVMQYMSFATAATNKMLVAGLQQRDIAMMTGLLPSLYLGYKVGESKAWLRGDDPSKWDAEKIMFEALDRSGVAGIYNIPLNAIVRPVLGDKSSRYIHRTFESVAGGSTISQLGRAGKIMQGAVDGDVDMMAEQAKRLTPFVSNTLHLRQILQVLGE